jgi:hypothetical protein
MANGIIEHFINDGQVSDKFKLVAATDVTLATYERVVRATQLTASISVTLPPVSAMEGKFVSCQVVNANSKVLTLQDADDSQDWTDLTLDADNDGVLLYSDGIKWWVVTNDIA